MQLLKKLLQALWKIWFYILTLLVILLFSPLLIISLSSDKFYPFFMQLARIWAIIVFHGIGFRYKLYNKQPLDRNKSYMFVANHTSMMDIMLTLIIFKQPFVFIGKKELSKLPIFGFFYKKACIMVDRSNPKSRQESIRKAKEKLHSGRSICIFPEGHVPDDESIVLDTFKDGAFRLAIEFQIPIVALSINQLKKHFPFRFFAGSPRLIPVYMHPPFETKGLTLIHKQPLKQNVRNTILSKLES